MLTEIESKRGAGAAVNNTEIAGGRTVMRVSEVHVVTEVGVDENIMLAIDNFFNAAQSAISGKKQQAKHSAVSGAKRLVSGALESLLGVSNGQCQERTSFVVLFMNNAFVRVDYCAYSYSTSAKKYGQEVNKSGACYVADLSVLDAEKLFPAEIDFLLSQALDAQTDDLDHIEVMKMKLIESAVLSRMITKPGVTFSDLTRVSKGLATVHGDIEKTYRKMKEYESSSGSGTSTTPSSKEAGTKSSDTGSPKAKDGSS